MFGGFFAPIYTNKESLLRRKYLCGSTEIANFGIGGKKREEIFFMLRKKKQSARCAKIAGITDKGYLCRERVAAFLKLMRSTQLRQTASVFIHTDCPPFGAVTQRTHTQPFVRYALPVEKSKLSGFSKLIRYLTELITE